MIQDALFVLDESCFSSVTFGPDFGEWVEQIFDRIDVARERNEGVTASTELFKQKTQDGQDLSFLLFDLESPLSQEIKERFVVLSASLELWDEVEDWPAIDATISEISIIAPSIAWAHSRVKQGTLTGCLSIPVVREGQLSVTVDGIQLLLWFVSNDQNHLAFFRDAIRSVGSDQGAFRELSPHAFPGIRFLEDAWGGLNDLSKPFTAYRMELADLFGILSDHGAWSFTAPGPALRRSDVTATDSGSVTDQIIANRFVTFGINIAPEKPNVRLDSICRADRERIVDDNTIYFEWHCKLQPHIDRVHVHGPIPPDNRVIVGILHKHLRLP